MTDLLDQLPAATPVAGGWRSALYRPDAPGAVLDGQPWAANWATFMRAINDPRDSTARQFIANAMSERIPAEGGFLVPEVLRSQVMSYMAAAVIRPQAMVLPMSSLRLPVPILDNPSQASSSQVLGGLTFSFTEEAAAISNTTPSFGRVVLEARKLAALMTVPNELADDSPAFGDFLARVIAKGYAWVEDDYFIGTNGSGTGCPQGLVNAPCAVAVSRAGGAGKVIQADIATMFKALHPAAKMSGYTPGYTNVRWLLSASAMDQLLELYFAIGTPTNQAVAPSDWFQAGDGDRTGPSMLGLPVTVTDHQPAVGSTGDIILADLSLYLIGDRQLMTVERATHTLFANDQSYFRVRAHVDGRYWMQSSSTSEAGQSISPVVVLH